MKLRRGTLADIPQILDVKHGRRLTDQTSGGFLLGSDAAGYARQLEHGNVWVLDRDAGLAGFATTLGATAFRVSPLFTAQESIRWSADVSAVLAYPIAYFDQLAVRASVSSRAAARLAFVALWDLFAQGARAVVSTTVAAPIRNRASIPFIEHLGGTAVGHLTETYPEVGELVSVVWLFTQEHVRERLDAPTSSGRFLRSSLAVLPAP